MNAVVSLKVGILRGHLSLARTPKYLRFVMVGADWKTLDALDQLDDSPKPEEHLIAAVKGDESTVHIDGIRNGRRFGEWRRCVTYHLVPEQPDQETMRDREKWQAWCLEANRKTVVETEKTT